MDRSSVKTITAAFTANKAEHNHDRNGQRTDATHVRRENRVGRHEKASGSKGDLSRGDGWVFERGTARGNPRWALAYLRV